MKNKIIYKIKDWLLNAKVQFKISGLTINKEILIVERLCDGAIFTKNGFIGLGPSTIASFSDDLIHVYLMIREEEATDQEDYFASYKLRLSKVEINTLIANPEYRQVASNNKGKIASGGLWTTK